MKKVLLIIMDGWGISKKKENSAIDLAETPFFDSCLKEFPNTTLSTFGAHVGLPEGQMGNSEVGHIHLGAGRVIYQNLEKINRACEDGTLASNEVLKASFQLAKEKNKPLHFLGLVSNGGVHSHINHLSSLIKAADEEQVPKVFVHAITDGRDCDPKSGADFIDRIEREVNTTSNSSIASVIGRYFAMDRDKRWERTQKAYDLLIHAKGKNVSSFREAILDSYKDEATDEFLEPLWNSELSEGEGKIKEGDIVVFFNFRTDRGRQLTEVITQKDHPDFEMKTIPLHFSTMTRYDEKFKGVSVLFNDNEVENTLGEVLSKSGLKQLRVAETEKYPHVTFFFSGGNEEPFFGESRILCPSPRDVATYDLKPEMAAFDIRDQVLPELEKGDFDFICLNFANPDMVGHTGSISATKKACEIVDSCSETLCNKALEKGYDVLVLADHGNADVMKNEDGSPNTQHSTNPVPLIHLSKKSKKNALSSGGLADIAPTILHLMGVDIPKEMSGKVLIQN